MSKALIDILQAIAIGVTFFFLSYLVGLGYRMGQNAANQTKKVCDACFRNIGLVNERYAHLKSKENNES